MKVIILALILVSQNLSGNQANFAESSAKNFVILSVSEESKNNPSLRANPQGFARAVARSNHPPIEKGTELQGGLPRSLALARNDEILDSSVAPLPQNDKNSVRVAESNIDSANSTKIAESANKTQQTIEGIAVEVAEFLGDFECKTGLESAQCSKSPKSPQDAPKSKLQTQDEFALCKDDIIGFWLSPLDKVSARTSIIEIFKKDGKYFAYNVAFLDELPPKKDALNQNFALRDREILGSIYAYNLERSGEKSYINGRYYDFNRGKIFHLKAKLDCNELILLISADNVGFLGKKKIYKALEKSEAEFYIKTRPTIDFSGVK